jgi:hypothetical protein
VTSKAIQTFRKKIEKDWGKKCKYFCWTCVVCQTHFALDILEDNYRFIEPGGPKHGWDKKLQLSKRFSRQAVRKGPKSPQ